MVEIGFDVENTQVKTVYVGSLNGTVRLDVDNETFQLLVEGKQFKIIDNELVRDTAREQQLANEKEIQELKQYLADTDYIIIKIKEAEITNTTTQDYSTEIAQRQAARNRINELGG